MPDGAIASYGASVEEAAIVDEQARPERPAPSGMEGWASARVTLHLTGAGRVKSLTGTLTDVAGDGFTITEEDADWWVPREMVQAVQRPHDQGDQ